MTRTYDTNAVGVLRVSRSFPVHMHHGLPDTREPT